MIIYSLLDAVTGPFWMAIFATGKIKKYQIILSVFIFSSIILSYFSLYFGGSPESVLWIRVGINVLVLLIRVYFVKYLLNITKNFIKNTPINRGNTPKYVFYIFFLCQVILVIEEKGGVCH